MDKHLWISWYIFRSVIRNYIPANSKRTYIPTYRIYCTN